MKPREGRDHAARVVLIYRARYSDNKRTVDVREVLNGLMYVLSTGCQWRGMPKVIFPLRPAAVACAPAFKRTDQRQLLFYICRGNERVDT